MAQSLLDCCSAPPHGWSNAPIKDEDGRAVPSDFERRIRAWVHVLEPLSDDELSTAALAWARGPRSAFMPAPGELLQLARPAVTDADREVAGQSAWSALQAIRHNYREANGYGFQWRDDARQAAFRERIGPVAWAALETIGGVAQIERAALIPDGGKELEFLKGRYVTVFRAIEKRANGAAPLDRPQIGAAPARAIGADADLAPNVAERLRVHAMRGAS